MGTNSYLGEDRAGTQGMDIIPITPDDNSDLATHVRAIRCKPTNGTSGTLRITTWANKIRNTEIVAGETLYVYAKKVHDTGTTADGLEGLL